MLNVPRCPGREVQYLVWYSEVNHEGPWLLSKRRFEELSKTAKWRRGVARVQKVTMVSKGIELLGMRKKVIGVGLDSGSNQE